MSLNQFAYAGMNPITMSDPTGMMPQSAFDCTPQQQQHLVRNWSQTYGAAVQSGGDGAVQAGTGGSGYSPGPPAQESAPAIIYIRGGGKYAVAATTGKWVVGSLNDLAYGDLDVAREVRGGHASGSTGEPA